MSATALAASRLLLVEDSRADAYLVRLLARDLAPDVTIDVVGTGEAALDALAPEGEDPPDLVLLDLNLPRFSGHDVLAALLARGSTAGLPIVVFSSSSDEHDRARSMRLGATDYVTKPGDLREFKAVLADLLERFLPPPD